ncbi:hypothetical protein GIY62_17445 [Burkholderia plantarii]|uniref:hypothetical protein n=1 Tax=Burkholderia plantarii TaxID=41899 RepID=UPI00272A7134|nr:hypothetical protein [Burkholderia plantarii]WLE58867.1 hypothetical protein GIY62_17445 [Burkholderia plantarii]
MISRTTLNQLTDILRSELDRKVQSRPGAVGGKAAGGAARQDGPRPLAESLRAHIAGLVNAGVTDEAQLARAAVEHMLHRQFGDELVNDPSFQSVASRVAQTVMENEELRKALMGAVLGG